MCLTEIILTHICISLPFAHSPYNFYFLSSGLPTRILQVSWYHSPELCRFFLLHFSCCTLIHLHPSLIGFFIPQLCVLSFTSLTSWQAVCSWCVFLLQNSSSDGCGCITSRFYCLCITCLFSVECWLDTSPSWVYPYFSLRLVPCAAVFILSVRALFLKTNNYLKLIQKISQIALC